MDKLQELRQMLAEMKDETRSLLDADKVTEAETKMEEVRKLEKQIELQIELNEEEERAIDTTKTTKGTEKMEQRQAFIKVLQNKATVEERALVQSSVDTDGGYIVPKEIKTDINELKRSYKSAKELVDVITTSTDAGSFVIEEGANVTALVNFDEDNNGLDVQAPKFKNVAYKIGAYGAITPISNSFLQDETGNFMSYLNRLFARKAIHTENTKIFAELKAGKTAKKVADIKAIKDALHKLDPAISANAVVVVNQTAFARLDQLEDGNGRPLLQANPADATQMMLLGRPVHLFSDAELPNVAGRGAMFIGDLREGVKFFDRNVYEVAVSTEAGFTKNQTVARVVERFDVKQGDATAYEYLEVEEPAVEVTPEG